MTVIITHKGGTIEAHKAIDFLFSKKNKRLEMWVEGRKGRRFLLIDFENEEIENVSIDGQIVYDGRLED